MLQSNFIEWITHFLTFFHPFQISINFFIYFSLGQKQQLIILRWIFITFLQNIPNF